MIIPHLWSLRRPGIFLPVFFLSLFLGRLNGQLAGQEASEAALGGTFVSQSGHSCAIQNQAGLAWVEDHSLSLNHCRPYLELGISSFGLQVNTEKGALGAFLSSYGIPGLRQSSFWASYGMTLSSVISMGLGMHFWAYSLPEKMIHHPGISLALGLQAKINKQWILGIHILHPRVWVNPESGQSGLAMTLSAGFSYSFFKTATVHSELHISPGKRIQWASGMEWTIRRSMVFMLGIHNQPLTWSLGLIVHHKSCELQMAIQYVTDTGSIPSTSIHYAW